MIQGLAIQLGIIDYLAPKQSTPRVHPKQQLFTQGGFCQCMQSKNLWSFVGVEKKTAFTLKDNNYKTIMKCIQCCVFKPRRQEQSHFIVCFVYIFERSHEDVRICFLITWKNQKICSLKILNTRTTQLPSQLSGHGMTVSHRVCYVGVK